MMRLPVAASRSRIAFPLAAAVVTLITAVAYHAIPDLPLAPQSDEPKKADFVISGRQDFFHPILMLQTVRLMNIFAGHHNLVDVVGLGRAAAAIFGALTVLATVILARRVVGQWLALAAGCVAAVTPLLALHAQLFKEDVFVAPWLVSGIAALDWLCARPGFQRAAVFGLLVGLAVSSKYIGVVLLPLACLAPLIGTVNGPLKRYNSYLALAAAIALVTFGCLNAPALFAPASLTAGLGTEINHALTGHTIISHGWYTHFLFHWTTSLVPGAGLMLSSAALAGAAFIIKDWRSHPPAIRLVMVFGIAWYLLHELSPMKPFMAVERHMTVMAPVFAVLTVYLIDRISSIASASIRGAVAATLLGVIALPMALSTIALARSAPDDTRVLAEKFIGALDGPVAIDWHATMPGYIIWPRLSGINESTQYVMIVEPVAKRFIDAQSFPNQPHVAQEYITRYRELFDKPAILLRSTNGSFSYRNVPIRIVALRRQPDQLEALIAKAGILPKATLSVFNGVRIPGRRDSAR